MIDGKVCNIITESSNQVCNVCNATPKMMNEIDKILTRPVKTETLKYGISILHAWIRFYELCLHVSYRLDIKTAYKVYTSEEKNSVALRKRNIQDRLREEIVLLADKPKSGGKGNTNDGNSARRFFEDPIKTAQITGLDVELLEQFRNILITLSCGFAADVEAFRIYTEKTAKNYVNLYSWYYISSSVHKVLIHGSTFMAAAIVPLGLLSEEALESRHKDLRYYRCHHTRKVSRKDSNSDLLNALLISSDPVINSYRKKPKKKTLKLNHIILSLLAEPSVDAGSYIMDCCEIESESE